MKNFSLVLPNVSTDLTRKTRGQAL